jgi:FkbM family methyltransferase
MASVFLDVGGHVGETLGAVTAARWSFDRIWSFEPSSTCWPQLDAIDDPRVQVVHAGLWSSNTEMELNDSGGVHASIERRAWHGFSEVCRFIDSAAWFAEHLSHDDTVWMKVNIEAAEVEVLDRLIDSGEIAKVDHLVVHFDVENIGMFDEANYLRARLDAAGVDWQEADTVLFGRTVAAKTDTWLLLTTGRRWRFRYRRAVHRARRRVWLVRRRLWRVR